MKNGEKWKKKTYLVLVEFLQLVRCLEDCWHHWKSVVHVFTKQKVRQNYTDPIEQGNHQTNTTEHFILRVCVCVRAIVSQTNIGTVSKARWGHLTDRQGGAHIGLPERIDTSLKWSEVKWTSVCQASHLPLSLVPLGRNSFPRHVLPVPAVRLLSDLNCLIIVLRCFQSVRLDRPVCWCGDGTVWIAESHCLLWPSVAVKVKEHPTTPPPHHPWRHKQTKQPRK